MQFVTYNIQFGVGRDARLDLARIADTVAGADVIALQEVTRAWPTAADGDQPEQLAALLGDYHWVYAPSVNVAHPDAASHATARGARQQFGNMLLCKMPILASRTHSLPRHETQDIPRVALEGIIETPKSGPLRLYCVHLAYKEEQERAAQVRALIELHRTAWGSGSHITPLPSLPSLDVPGAPQCAFVMGDFNMLRSESVYQEIIDPVGNHFVDAWVAGGNDPNCGVTMPANPATQTSADSHLDYGFISNTLADRIRCVRIDNDASGSDHQPVWFDVDL